MSTRNLPEMLEQELGPYSFGRFLRSARTSRDLTQVEMAKFIGISKSVLCDIEKERQLVSPALAAKIARRCGFSEFLAVEAAITDQLRRSKLKMRVQVKPLDEAA